MDELTFVFVTAGVIVVYFLAHVITGKFDPFAPVWLFLVGYIQPYIIQAISYHDWAVSARGKDLVAEANFRSFWALLWFLLVYQLPIGRMIASKLTGPPVRWSPTRVAWICPPLILWGLFCAGMLIRGGAASDDATMSAEESLFRSFPFVMMVAAILLIVTGRSLRNPRPEFLVAGLVTAAAYIVIWMFNGKRSHSLIGVLTTVCAYYSSRLARPSWPVLLSTGFAGAVVVAIAIGWRGNMNYERSFTGFVHYLGDFKLSKIFESVNVSDGESGEEIQSYETHEYGGFLLMMDTVPAKSDYDYGANYLRIFSTFIPRLLWPSKPIFGRDRWISAWVAGSEMEREDDFSGPAIGILGASQLNGGALGTVIVMACAALLLRTAFEYFRLHADNSWAQFWWSIAYYNAWFMVVCDDPLIWFYYNWGFTTFPLVVCMWWLNRGSAPGAHGQTAAVGVLAHEHCPAGWESIS